MHKRFDYVITVHIISKVGITVRNIKLFHTFIQIYTERERERERER